MEMCIRDSDYIEERAVNDLGMTEPQEYQIKTISVPEQSYTVQYNESKNEMPEVKDVYKRQV